MQEHEKTLFGLLIAGFLIAMGKLLNGAEPITKRQFLGRLILGTGVSVTAGAALLWVPNLSPLAIIALGTAMGIAGHTWFEYWLRKKGASLIKGKKL